MKTKSRFNLLVKEESGEEGNRHSPWMIQIEGSRQEKKPGQIDKQTELAKFGIDGSDQGEGQEVCPEKNKRNSSLFFHRNLNAGPKRSILELD